MKIKVAGLLLVFMGSLFPALSPAVLGESVESVQEVNQALKSKAEILSQSKALENGKKLSWTVHVMKAQGTTVKEYVSPSGKVFAVSWSGVKDPDLKILLGSYYKEFSEAETAKKIPKGQRVKSIESENLKARQSGVMRDMRSQVVVKELIPQGLQAQEIQ